MLRRTLLALTLALSVSAAGCGKDTNKEAAPLKVAAAADLAVAFEEVGKAFEKKTGNKVTFSFGSTGLLSKQILEGAPFDVFAAANVSFVDEVVGAGQCDRSTQELYARGRVVVWSKKGAPAPKDLADLADPRFKKIAIANPEHAPYGRAAKEAMSAAKVWESLDREKRLVFGENVQQTLQFAQTGNADVAIVALSLATTSDGEWKLIDESLHKPLDQALVVCGDGVRAERAKEFTSFVNSPEGREIMTKYGFLLPGEKTAASE